jgi:tetratricopeptide (TPR) repeat protein
VTPRPLIFISAVSRELRSARQLVANTLTFLGYQPVWQDIFGTETGDLRSVLRKKIDQCKGMVQLVGQSYGAEAPTADEEFGRVSYTQYEALYARQRGKKVWYLFIDETFPIDAHESEPEELRELQASYRRRLQSDTHVFHPLTSSEALEASVLKLRDDLTRLRRGVKQWAVGVAALLIVILALVIWQLRGQAEMKAEMAKLLRQGIMEYPRMEAQVHGSQPEKDQVALQERIYAELGKQLGVDHKILREKLPRFADELRHMPNASAYERANASYVAGDYAEAERLALQAADEAQKLNPSKPRNAIQAFELAGLSAQKRIEYARAMGHFREAEKLTDRDRNPEDWAEVQFAIANLLIDQGQYSSAENILRSVVGVRAHVLGPEHPETLRSRNGLDIALWQQGKDVEAEADFRELIRLEEKVLGPEHPDTLLSRNGLANIILGQGKYAEAEAEYRLILKLREKVLGPEHPDTLRSRDNLAIALDSQGKYAEAEAEYRLILKLREKVLGPEHPDTLGSRNSLGAALFLQGKFAEAEAQLRELIKIDEKVLGPEHPDTLMFRGNLAKALDEQGRYAEAEAQLREVIKIKEKVLGPEHPETLGSRDNLAVALDEQGKYAEAEADFREVIKIEEKVLGAEHPDTLDSYYDFASGLERQNKLQEAKEFARRAAEGARKVLGPNHPSTQKYEKLLAELQAKP